MKHRSACAAVLSLLLLQACAYRPAEVADPNDISLRKAIFDVADTLAETKARTRNRDKVGLYVDEAVVTFNISSKSTESESLKIGASAPAGFLPVSASGEASLVNEGSRGNTITITFKNIGTTKATPGVKCPKGVAKPGCPPVVMMRPS